MQAFNYIFFKTWTKFGCAVCPSNDWKALDWKSLGALLAEMKVSTNVLGFIAIATVLLTFPKIGFDCNNATTINDIGELEMVSV